MKSFVFALVCVTVAASAQANDSHSALQESFMKALRAGDAAGMASNYTADAVSYDVSTQSVTGPAGVEASWSSFFAAYKVLKADLFNNTIETHGETGIAWGEFKIVAEPVGGGDPVEMVGRYSDVSRNIDGKWLYIMDHASMPLPPPPEE